jgi:hypothetical protein
MDNTKFFKPERHCNHTYTVYTTRTRGMLLWHIFVQNILHEYLFIVEKRWDNLEGKILICFGIYVLSSSSELKIRVPNLLCYKEA